MKLESQALSTPLGCGLPVGRHYLQNRLFNESGKADVPAKVACFAVLAWLAVHVLAVHFAPMVIAPPHRVASIQPRVVLRRVVFTANSFYLFDKSKQILVGSPLAFSL